MTQQLPLFADPGVVLRGAVARSAARLCTVDGCCYVPVQVDRWGQLWCATHQWRTTEERAQAREMT